MKKAILFVINLAQFLIYKPTYSQFICGYHDGSSHSRAMGYISNGGVFTPKGDLRILIVFVTYGEKYDTLSYNDWPIGTQFPKWKNELWGKPFYGSYSEFPQNIYSDTSRLSVSNFYYQMSNGLFRIIADYYPDTVRVELSQDDNWTTLNTKVLNRISSNINWDNYDNRTNTPNYSYDNSSSLPDGIADYVVFCHRLQWWWDSIVPLPSGLKSYEGANGFASTAVNVNVGNGYYVGNSGFTLMTGGYGPIYIFPHEIGHTLYTGPHYNGVNGVCGNYFYMPASGWGMMNIGFNYTCALGWERYILDWTPQIKTSNIPADIDEPNDLVATNGVFTLRDFITTGDAIRIKIPTVDGSHQYLWIENHQGLSTFDGFIHRDHFCEEEVEEYKKGLVAYVEGFSHAKEVTDFYLMDSCNAIRWLTKNGDYDFSFTPPETKYSVICNNKSYPMHIGLANPISGQSVNEYIRQDFNNDGKIGHDTGINAPSSPNERAWAVDINDEMPTARWMTGSGMQFHEGDKVGMATNPTVRNMPKYDSNNKKMGDYYLNGISFEVLGRSVGNTMRVKVRLDDVAVDRDVRWAAASIVLGDITGDNRPDVDVQPNIKLTIDMSGTPNRHANPDNPNQTTSVLEDFITPTRFACRNGAFFKQEPYSVVEVKNGSTLVLENGSVYEVGDHASLTIEPSATLVVKSGATLRVLGSGHVEVADLAYICVEDGAYIDLVDTVSAVNLMPLAVQGTYSYGNVPQCTCTLTDITEYPLAHGSNGGIYQCNTDRIISSTTYTHDAYECGLNIRAGRISDGMTRPRDVVIDNGTRVVMDAAQSVSLEPGFKVNAGGRLEVR